MEQESGGGPPKDKERILPKRKSITAGTVLSNETFLLHPEGVKKSQEKAAAPESGGEKPQPSPWKTYELRPVQTEGWDEKWAEFPPRVPIEVLASKERLDEALAPYVLGELAELGRYRGYTPQEYAEKETAAGSPLSPEGQTYDEFLDGGFAQVAVAARRDPRRYGEAFRDLDAARNAFLLLSLKRFKFTERELHTNLGDIQIAPEKVELTPRQAKIVDVLAKRASLPYDTSETVISGIGAPGARWAYSPDEQ
ncbi:hypothetical protein ACIQI7_33730 [Kitasatospora sp. NPDC092039]|uniref:hypothetical protein n=1 Tax=Kitasatospora sp. NPDC092039 TaxID=3364086 RepID=UPI003825C439